jgi:hypothetical protein
MKTPPKSDALLGLEDVCALREVLPPKRGELLRAWMLRCTCLGLVKKEEALRIRANNLEAWEAPYILEPNDSDQATASVGRC